MSNEKALQQHEREQERRQAEFDRLYNEYRDSIANRLRHEYDFFASEYEDRLSSINIKDESFLHEVWQMCNDPSDELAVRRLRSYFDTLIMDLANERADFESEAGGLEE